MTASTITEKLEIKDMTILVYRRTHTGDPSSETHEFGYHDCMGQVRNWHYHAVIGIGGCKPDAGYKIIEKKITWVGIYPEKRAASTADEKRIEKRFRGPLVTFEKFILWTEKELEEKRLSVKDQYPKIYEYMFKNKRIPRAALISKEHDIHGELEEILEMAMKEEKLFRDHEKFSETGVNLNKMKEACQNEKNKTLYMLQKQIEAKFMKIIFSRKGFDASAGGFPSPIFPDNRLFSIPIPSSSNHYHYSSLDFSYAGHSIQSILNDLTHNKIQKNGKKAECDYSRPEQGCHHDPMYIQASSRLALGQAERAESHLKNQKISEGDVFLYYGWFKKITQVNDRWMYSPGAKDIHLIWSSMKVAFPSPFNFDTPKKRDDALAAFPELTVHPHLAIDWDGFPNGVYISDKQQALLPYSDNRCLTDMKQYSGRAKWRLPILFNQPRAFSHLKSFIPENQDVLISYRGYGQEFVLDLDKVSPSDRHEILRYVEKICIP